MRTLAVVALAALGGFAGWALAASAAPSNAELRKGATELVPSQAWLDEVKVVDRPASFSNPPWDVGGDRYTEAVLTPPRKVDEQAFQDAVAARAGAAGWSRTGTSGDGGPRYRRANLGATVETTAFEPGVGLEAAIRVRPRSLSGGTAVLVGAVCGLLVGVIGARLLGRRRRPAR